MRRNFAGLDLNLDSSLLQFIFSSPFHMQTLRHCKRFHVHTKIQTIFDVVMGGRT